MTKGEQTRQRIIAAASHLFQVQGYAATGMQQILTEGKAPRGSFYFHFPGGKEELAVAAVHAHSEAFLAGLEQAVLHAPTTASAAEAVIDQLSALVESTGCEAGCPVGALALELANESAALRAATRAAFDAWVAVVVRRLEADGLAPEAARGRATALICAIEGALVLSRSHGDASPLRAVRDVVPALLP